MLRLGDELDAALDRARWDELGVLLTCRLLPHAERGGEATPLQHAAQGHLGEADHVVTRAGVEVEDADDEQLVLEIRPGTVVEEGLERLAVGRVRRVGLVLGARRAAAVAALAVPQLLVGADAPLEVRVGGAVGVGRLKVLPYPVDKLDLVGECLLEVDVELTSVGLEHVPPVALCEGHLLLDGAACEVLKVELHPIELRAASETVTLDEHDGQRLLR
mmetsp:Transcript_1310/g.3166  ORF Transcript_1310/g.3166 Transcript_1310/m.3166 type:complete len:218 (-) Transcript_1310:582-1235(-)